MANVKASYLIEKFKYMVEKKWKYVACAAQEGAVDCSGAFTYWYKKAGGYMYHGSNTMWRKYSTEKGKITDVSKLVPGAAVYKMRQDGKEPSAYKKDGLGNFYHVGLYLGNGKVAEAKGTHYGCVFSDISAWGYYSLLKNTDYDVGTEEKETTTTTTTATYPMKGTVNTSSGSLNLRAGAGTSYKIITRIPKGTTVEILGEENSNWYKIKYNNQTGYVS